MRLLIGRPPQTMIDLIDALNVTRTAVTEQLNELLAIGFIEQKQEHYGGRGRPKYYFSATDAAMQHLFEGLQGIVVPSTWRSIRKRFGDETLDSICQDIAADIADIYDRRIISKIPRERLKEFVTIQTNNGRLIEYRENADNIEVLKFNCPFFSMVDEAKTLCHVDRLTMQMIAGGDVQVEHTESRLEGHPCCTFRLQTAPFTLSTNPPADNDLSNIVSEVL
jgi:predicted ArsR family transcriptional regulator